MKIRLKSILLGLMVLTCLASCEQDDPFVERNSGANFIQPLEVFELEGSISDVPVEPLSSNTDEVDESLRASLHFRGKGKPAQTTLEASDFGRGKRSARWGVLYGNNQYGGANCTKAITEAPSDPSKITENTVLFKNTASSSLSDGSIRMYSVSEHKLERIQKAIMLLDGTAGEGSDLMKQYYMQGKSDPNHRLEPVEEGGFQSGRHIPFMTELTAFDAMQPIGANTARPKVSPRGSLVGLRIKNRTGADIILTGLVVHPGDGALDYGGYFDWSKAGKPVFTPKYSSVLASQELVFPIYADKSATTVGATVVKGNQTEPCFFLWGYQNSQKKGQDLRLQIRYKEGQAGQELTTPVFKVHPPKSRLEQDTKQFDDGYAYNVALTIKKEDTSMASCEDVRSVSLDFTTPLDFVAEMPALNKKGTGFVKNHCLPHTDIIADMYDDEVGYFDSEEAVALFKNQVWLKEQGYYLPTVEQLQSLTLSSDVNLNGTIFKGVEELAQVGETPINNYSSDYIFSRGKSCYAVRFKGDPRWTSAWYYSYIGEEQDKKLIIKCVPLIGKNSNKTLEEISNPEFFIVNKCSIRIFPAYGVTDNKIKTFKKGVDVWIRGKGFSYLYSHYSFARIYNEADGWQPIPIRPFRKAPKN